MNTRDATMEDHRAVRAHRLEYAPPPISCWMDVHVPVAHRTLRVVGHATAKLTQEKKK